MQPSVKRFNPTKEPNIEAAIDNLFTWTTLDHTKELLWDWHKATVSNSFDQVPNDDRVRLMTLYEKLVELVEVAHIYHLECKNSKKRKHKTSLEQNTLA